MNKLFSKLPSRERFRFFLLFVLLSFVFWISTKLSKSYTLEEPFNISWEDLPVGVVLNDMPKQITLSVTASGIELLMYRWLNTTIEISLQEAIFTLQKGELDLRNQYYLISQQLFQSTQMNQIVSPVLTFNYSRLEEKKVVVIPDASIQFRAGYLGDTDLTSTPDSVLVRGPKSQLDSIKAIETQRIKVSDLFEDYNQKIDLKIIPGVRSDFQSVQLKMAVSRYTEKEYSIPLEVIHLPPGVRVKLFPPSVKLRATIPLNELKSIQGTDFVLAVDYVSLIDNKKSLEVRMIRKPLSVKQLNWEPKQVNYLIRK